jgi:hypothetical protein
MASAHWSAPCWLRNDAIALGAVPPCAALEILILQWTFAYEPLLHTSFTTYNLASDCAVGQASDQSAILVGCAFDRVK